ncbi:uncharacterized protein LOC109721542 isoform X4 [Ananas comosus]|uniref:Uncharacterized protein LOC109721542 isoform X4 n=1 Tax=Ananas comosus TaxID=4615 RepID=A0A6P5GFT9_ANACO|nr:uncharacterized protein LOC109721542 isoform X4 [Ananas comosus]
MRSVAAVTSSAGSSPAISARSWSSSTGAAAPWGTGRACCLPPSSTWPPPTAPTSSSPSSPSATASATPSSPSSPATSPSSSSSPPSSVCYLNNHGKDFKGGIFHFQDGEPSAVVPFAGDVVIYTADRRNVHCVDEVIEGERLTLTLWFTRDSAHDEDAKLLSLLSHQPSSNNNFNNPNCFLPSPASNNMYWFSNEKSGFDIRCARVQFLGYSFLTTSDLKDSSSDQSIEPFEQLNNPLTLARGDEVFDMKFINSLHALQVLQFYYWKASELAAARSEAIENSESPQLSFRFRTSTDMEICLPCDRELAENTLGCSCYEEAKVFTDSNDLSLAVVAWENYSCKLRRDLLSLMPHWLPNQSIFFADPSELRMYNG